MPTAPDPRRGRACDACHANKTKCDGGTKCTLCIKRGICCTYKHASKSGSKSPLNERRNTPESVSSPSPSDEIKAAFKRIGNSVRTGEIPIGEATPIPAVEHPWIDANTKEYFGRLHDSFPLLHAPSYRIGMEDSYLVAVSVAMISCWLRNPDEFGPVVMELHETFMDVYSRYIVS